MIGGLIAAWLDMRSKPLRTLAAIAGMIAAVTAVVLVDAAGVLSQQASAEYLARRNGLPVTVSVVATVPDYQDELVEVLTRSGLEVWSPQISQHVNVLYDDLFQTASIQFATPSYDQIRVVDLMAGAWPRDTAEAMVSRVVISEDYARRIGFDDPGQAIGQPLYFSPQSGFDLVENQEPLTTLVIDGVASSGTNAFEGVDILLVSSQPPPWMPADYGFLVRVNPEDFPMLQELFDRTEPTTRESMFSWNRIDQSEEFAPVLRQQQVTSRIVQIVALTVGGLGVLGVGLASVRERARDFGLRRALGASTDMVFGSVLVQSLLEALLASILAVPLTFAMLRIFARQLVAHELPLPAVIELPLRSLAWGVGCAIVVGVLAGLAPAVVAARASVAQSLRA